MHARKVRAGATASEATAFHGSYSLEGNCSDHPQCKCEIGGRFYVREMWTKGQEVGGGRGVCVEEEGGQGDAMSAFRTAAFSNIGGSDVNL